MNADFENLKGRIEDLEATDGEASVPIVGNSKLGYVSDFTDYGLNNQYYVQADWKDESRSLQFGAESNLGDVLEEMMYVTASGITNINNRVSALENNSDGSDTPLAKQIMGADSISTKNVNIKLINGSKITHYLKYNSNTTLENIIEENNQCIKDIVTFYEDRLSALESNSGGNCLENQVSIRQFYMVDKNDLIADGVPEEEIPALREQTINMTAAEGIENAYALAKSVKTKINVNVLPRLEALESGSGGSSSSGTSGGVTSTEVTEAINTAISPIESRLKSIEVGAHLMDKARLQPYSLLTDEAREVLGLPLTAIEENYTYKYYLTEGLKRAHYGYGESQVNRNKITALSNTVAGHTNTIQSLDTRTGSHTASIGQLENRMTDVDNYSKANRTMITGVATSLSNTQSDVSELTETLEEVKTDISNLQSVTNYLSSKEDKTETIIQALAQLNSDFETLEEDVETLKNNDSSCSCPSDVESRLTALENNSGSSGESTNITHIGDINIKSDGSEYSYDIADTASINSSTPTYTTYTFATLIGGLEQFLSNINTLSTRIHTLEYKVLLLARKIVEMGG